MQDYMHVHIHSRVHEIHFFGKWGGGIDNLAASFCTLNQNILKTPEMKSLLRELNR